MRTALTLKHFAFLRRNNYCFFVICFCFCRQNLCFLCKAIICLVTVPRSYVHVLTVCCWLAQVALGVLPSVVRLHSKFLGLLYTEFKEALQGSKFLPVWYGPWPLTLPGPVELSLPLVCWTSNVLEKCPAFFLITDVKMSLFLRPLHPITLTSKGRWLSKVMKSEMPQKPWQHGKKGF